MALGTISQVGAIAAAVPVIGAASRAAGAFARLLGGSLRAGAMSAAARDGDADATGQVAPSPVSPGRVNALRERTAALEAQLVARFQALMASQGIETGEPVRLGFDDFGNVRVAGSHPQAAAIDHALAADPEFAEMFHSLAAMTQVLTTAEAEGSPVLNPLDTMSGWTTTGSTDRLESFVLTVPGAGASDANA